MPQEEDEEEESQEDYVTQFDDPVDIDPISEGAVAAAVEGQEYSQDELLEMGKLWFSSHMSPWCFGSVSQLVVLGTVAHS